MENIFVEPPVDSWKEIIQRPVANNSKLNDSVRAILDDVRLNGDDAIRKYALQFDEAAITEFKVSEQEIIKGIESLDEKLKAAIQLAKDNITKFHAGQLEEIKLIEIAEGITCWRKSVPIQNVGLYIPGGTAPLFSTLLMLGIPALIAGCKNVILCTPPGKEGNINPAILYTANLLGLKNIFKIGGVPAIAAMAYGSASVPEVDKIFGPGNQYVTCAKQLVNTEGIAIDMPAGPSEVAIYADETAVPSYIAADLLSQAEHGADSQVVLVATSGDIVTLVTKEIMLQLEKLPRKEIAEAALANSRFIVIKNIDTAFDFLNEYAAEHLIIASNNANELSQKVLNAGSVFIGNYSPEAAGDYASGTNHVLPTNGYAKTFSGVSVDSFVKKITFQQLDKTGLRFIGAAVETMAAAEGLDAHKNAITIRLKDI